VGRNGDFLRAGRSGDRIPEGARLFVPVQTGPRCHLAYYTMGNDSLFRGQSGRSVALGTHPHLAPRLQKEQRDTLCSPSGLSRDVLEWVLPCFIFFFSKQTLESLTVMQRARLFKHRLPQIAAGRGLVWQLTAYPVIDVTDVIVFICGLYYEAFE
jgi:hypothetical protein